MRREKIHKQAGMGAKNCCWSQKTRGRRIKCSGTEEDLFHPLHLSLCITIPTLSGKGRREDLQQLSISSLLNLHHPLTKQTVWRRDWPRQSFVYPVPSLPSAPDPVGVWAHSKPALVYRSLHLTHTHTHALRWQQRREGRRKLSLWQRHVLEVSGEQAEAVQWYIFPGMLVALVY